MLLVGTRRRGVSDVVFGFFSFNVFVLLTLFLSRSLVALLLIPVCEHLTLAWAGCEDSDV